MKLGLITYIRHKEYRSNFYSYGPYIREMNLWFRSPEQISIVAPKNRAKPECGEDHYSRGDIHFTKIPQISFTTFRSALKSIFKLPIIIFRIIIVFRNSDHIHLRCPGNITLLACLVQVFFPEKAKSVKYAGNWDSFSKQPWTYRFQKWILRNSFLTRNAQVLVYGTWPRQSTNIVSFFTASFSENEITRVKEKNFEESLIFLFVGNLVPGKRPLRALKIFKMVYDIMTHNLPDCRLQMEFYGHGPELENLEAYCRHQQLDDHVSFMGNRPLKELVIGYQKAHFIILPSKSEGWPKAIAEGMFFGCIPIATPVSCIPWMLGYGKRGILLTEDAPNEGTRNKRRFVGQPPITEDVIGSPRDVQKIVSLMENRKELKRKSGEAKAWSQQYTLEKFLSEINKILHGTEVQRN